MKKAIMLAMLLAFAASVSFAGADEAKDPITGTAEVVGKTATAPVEAVFGGKKADKKAVKEEKKAMKAEKKDTKKETKEVKKEAK